MRRRSPGQSGELVHHIHTSSGTHGNSKVSFSAEPLPSIKSRSLLSHGLHHAKSLVLYGAPIEHQASLSTKPSSTPRQKSRSLPHSIRLQSLVLYRAPTKHQASVCCCVYVVIFSVSVFALWLHLGGHALVLCSGALVLCLCLARLGFVCLVRR
jgi:hypothetical protein